MTEASKLLSKASNEIVLTVRPAPGQSEFDEGKDPGKGACEQVSFKDGIMKYLEEQKAVFVQTGARGMLVVLR